MLDLNHLIRAHMGVTLARLRGQRGLGVTDLASSSGLAADHLRAAEAGHALLSDDDRERLGAVLGVEPDCFYDGFMDSLRGGLWPAADTTVAGRA